MNDDEAWRSNNIGTLLFAARDRAIAVKLAELRSRGFAITEAQLALFHHVDAGMRLTTLAARASLSKAAMADTVVRAERSGLVARHPDPADRRAKVILPTAAGHALLAALDIGIAVAEQDAARSLGVGVIEILKDRLTAYISTPAERPSRTLIPAGCSATWAAANVGRLFSLGAQRFVQDVLAVVSDEGFDVGEALLGMVRNLDTGGLRLTEIAARARTTKQSMREMVGRAEALGFLVRRADPDDRRAKTIAFTPRGRDLLAAAQRGVGHAEAVMGGIVGRSAIAEVKVQLSVFAAAPRLVDPVDSARIPE